MLGFIVAMNGVGIYHAGDTDLIHEMERFNVDVACLPVSGTYVMTAEEAVESTRHIKLNVAKLRGRSSILVVYSLRLMRPTLRLTRRFVFRYALFALPRRVLGRL
jgi:hypothetical protein